MLEITCPNCKEKIKIGKDEYNALLSEIDKEELNKRVNERALDIEKSFKAKFELEALKLKSNQDHVIQDLNNQINTLKGKLDNTSKDTELAVNKATESLKEEIAKKNEDIVKLKNAVDSAKKDSDIAAQKLKEQYESQLIKKDSEIMRWKEYQMGNSTKDLGESLEKYCEETFESVRMVAYPDAYFAKDNLVDEEGKGDYIFRDYKNGIETVSIMFEMKNQKDDTVKKHKNEEFFSKLDKNRKSKKCEYAVLVSTLEEDSKLYNGGIVDVSHKYPKMFVIRPQFFLTIIGLIRNLAKDKFAYQMQLIDYQRQNADVVEFEKALKAVKDKINSDYEKAGAIYSEVDKMCNDIINKVEKFRDEFRIAAGWLGKAKNQLPELEIRSLTKNNPGMRERFASAESNETKEK